ncbi:MAG TPA: hypothetical protein VNQ73_07585 [Ilumatobacter sp.]|nr:hypothetical protein [Ilumatobacter sp.]
MKRHAAAALAAAVSALTACAPTDPAAYMPATTTTSTTSTTTAPPVVEPVGTTTTTFPVVEPVVATTTIIPVVSTSSTTLVRTSPTTTTPVVEPVETTTTTTFPVVEPVETTTTTTTPTLLPPATPALRTACRDVVHIGDSTGLAMWTASDLGGDPAATMDAQYRAIGVANVFPDNSGGRSLIERMPGQSNAVDVAEAVRDGGYRGCWVIMIGTNDAANVAAGAQTGHDERIARLMAVVGDQPVLWVNAVSRSAEPVYADVAMQQFNAALDRAVAVYPNLRVLDWARFVQPDWLVGDGLHYSTAGRSWRAAITAQALALAFPGDPGLGD